MLIRAVSNRRDNAGTCIITFNFLIFDASKGIFKSYFKTCKCRFIHNGSPGFNFLDFSGKLFAVSRHGGALGLSRQKFVLLFVESFFESIQRH